MVLVPACGAWSNSLDDRRCVWPPSQTRHAKLAHGLFAAGVAKQPCHGRLPAGFAQQPVQIAASAI